LDSQNEEDNDGNVDEEAPATDSRGRAEGSQPRGESMRAAAGEVPDDDQPMSQSRREEFLRKGLCFNCGGRGHRARDCPTNLHSSLTQCISPSTLTCATRCTPAPRCWIPCTSGAFVLISFSKSRRARWSP
ncbi:hypothetical protein DFH08DRAFT_863330, partial [Mycena albidolilacea]